MSCAPSQDVTHPSGSYTFRAQRPQGTAPRTSTGTSTGVKTLARAVLVLISAHPDAPADVFVEFDAWLEHAPGPGAASTWARGRWTSRRRGVVIDTLVLVAMARRVLAADEQTSP